MKWLVSLMFILMLLIPNCYGKELELTEKEILVYENIQLKMMIARESYNRLMIPLQQRLGEANEKIEERLKINLNDYNIQQDGRLTLKLKENK